MSARSGSAPQRVLGFDGLRGIAAFLVFCEHKVTRYTVGLLGVWVFFVLSGYLICGILNKAALGLSSADPGARLDALREFWRNRALRIFPVYYATLLGLFLFTSLLNLQQFLVYLAYLQNFYIGFVTHTWTKVTHFWSLAVEQQFYIAAAPALLWLRPSRHAHVLALTLLLCVTSVVVLELLSFNPMSISLLPSTNFSFILLGGLLKLLPSRHWFVQVVSSRLVLLLSAIAFLFCFARFVEPNDPNAGTPLPTLLSGLFFTGALVSRVSQHQQGRLTRLLELRPLVFLGVISYGFYVYHALIPDPERVLNAVGLVGAHLPRALGALVVFVLSLGLSYLSFRFVERPALRLKYHGVRSKTAMPS